MSEHVKTIAISAVLVLLAAFGALWWFNNMEQRWEAAPHRSEAARANRLLGAAMLLRQNGHPVKVAATLAEMSVPALPDGTLIMADSAGITSPEVAQQLLAWVRRGNTLVAQPREMTRLELSAYRASHTPAPASAAPDAPARDQDDEDEDSDDEAGGGQDGAQASAQVEPDPIAVRLGVRLYWPATFCTPAPKGGPVPVPKDEAKRCSAEIKAKREAPRRLSLPGAAYALELDAYGKLVEMDPAAAPLWSDELGDTVRVYGEGKGRIVMLANDFFNNHLLQRADHAELLLALATLNRSARHVTLVQYLDVLPWYRALWLHFSLALVSLACLLALCLWAALRRFGPMLPQDAGERRSLMEHIDASGAWLWKADGGRQLLLTAAREETLALVRRRAPQLARLPERQLAAALAALAGLDEQHVTQALHDQAAPQVATFTRQIRTLQELRNHYER